MTIVFVKSIHISYLLEVSMGETEFYLFADINNITFKNLIYFCLSKF